MCSYEFTQNSASLSIEIHISLVSILKDFKADLESIELADFS